MVENKQGVSTFLSFGAKSVKPEILEELLVGRRDTVDFLENCIREIAKEGQNHHKIIIGQRGMGKTHIFRVLYERTRILRNNKSIEIAYFSEEEYGIASYLDFLIRILNAFIRWNEEDAEFLISKMDILRETESNRQIEFAENIILEYTNKKPLVILAENFDNIIEALGKDGQAKLRSFLYRHTQTSIIASAQAISPDLEREDRPFYGFFTSIYLNKLTYEASLELLRNLALIEKQQNVIDHLKGKGIAQVRAIHDLVKGNHRLLVTFYEFLKADTLASLSTIFIKTLNDLKPYYESFIRYLPAQQQKILYYIALSKKAQNGTEIQKNCFIDSKTLSKQLSELHRRNLIDVIADPDDKRNKLYDIAEPLLRISIEIGEHKEGISALFIDFLALYYSFDELKTQSNRFENLFKIETDPQKKQEFFYEAKARQDAIFLKEELENNKKYSEAYKEMGEFYLKQDYQAVIKSASKVTDYEQDHIYYFYLGVAFHTLNQHDKAIESYQKLIKIGPDDFRPWVLLASVFFNNEQDEEAIEALQKAVEIKPDYLDGWDILGNTFIKKGEYEKAIEAFQKVIEISPDDFYTWLRLGGVFCKKEEFEKAIEAFQKAVDIKPDYFEAWFFLGYFYTLIGDITKAMKSHQKAIEVGSDYFKSQNEELKNAMLKTISNIIIFNLKHDKSLNISQVLHLEEIIEKEYEMPDELKTPYSYLQIYRRYVLQKEQKAIYDLPKEQRQFFEREILGKG